jgi:hypothetical protein
MAGPDFGIKSDWCAGTCKPTTERRARLRLHLLIEEILGLGLCQGTPVGCGVRDSSLPSRRHGAGASEGGRAGSPKWVGMNSTEAASMKKAMSNIASAVGCIAAAVRGTDAGARS